MRKPTAVVAAIVVVVSLSPLSSAVSIAADDAMQARILAEGMDRSEIMRTLHFLTDRYGPRLTGSPNLRLAGEWAVRQMVSWGLTNGHLEPFDFGRPGWATERHSVFLVSPVQDTLVAEVLAWTPSTKGTVRTSVVHMEPAAAEQPTAEELDEHLAGYAQQVRGRIVLVGAPAALGVEFDPALKRRADDEVQRRVDPTIPPEERRGLPRREPPERPEGALSTREVSARIDEFLVENGAAVRINDAGRRHGQIRAFSNRTYDADKAVPTLVMRNEDYGRIVRLVADGDEVQLEVQIINRWYPEGATSYNAVAEIRGTEMPDEVVMLGGHLDSWHSATGATDNATGCSIMLEAARILAALDVEPRRTIRVALWGGEEQGLLGSQAYVAQHFGSFEEPKPGYDKFGGYLNIDSGTGRPRGASVFGPPETGDILRAILAPLAELGVAGGIDTASRRRGGTDSTSFNAAGLPGIGFFQDPIEYGSHTWHTNLDTYERVVEDDVKAAAVVIASTVYELAMRDELLPRFSAEEMPAPAPPR